MPRLIYADALHRELVVEMVKCVRMSEETKMTMAERVLNKLDEAPTIDPESLRPHGRWIDCSNGWMCSNCERDNTYDKPYCPNCGADMQEKQDVEQEEDDE